MYNAMYRESCLVLLGFFLCGFVYRILFLTLLFQVDFFCRYSHASLENKEKVILTAHDA